MVTVKTRPNDNDGLDVVFLGLSFEETAAIRNAFSDVDQNREYARSWSAGIMDAIRGNAELSKVHAEYKKEIRDAVPAEVYEYDDEPVSDEFDGWE